MRKHPREFAGDSSVNIFNNREVCGEKDVKKSLMNLLILKNQLCSAILSSQNLQRASELALSAAGNVSGRPVRCILAPCP